MKIAIISDIHDNVMNLLKCLDFCEKNNVEKLLCCGDVTNDETISTLGKKFPGPIFLVRGNAEIFNPEIIKKFENINDLGKVGAIEIDSVVVGMCHQPFLIDEVIEKYAPQICFYGHTHKPWIEERAGIKVINPGTLSGDFSKATFAFWDSASKEIKLILLESLE